MLNSANPQIILDTVSFSYQKGKPTLKNVSLTINQGDRVALIGASGSGKTTLCHILKGIIPHAYKGQLSGKIQVLGKDLYKSSIFQLAQEVGMVFQDLNAQLFNNSVRDEIEFGLKNFKRPLNRALEAMKILEIDSLASEIPMNLSAGQKQRVAIASVLALEPKILILDEPSVHLDFHSRRQLRDWLLEINQKHQTTIILASNEPWLIGELCTTFFVVKDHNIQQYPKEQVIAKAQTWQWVDEE